MDKIKLGFDFDGVIANTNEKKQEWLKQNNLNVKEPNKTQFKKELQEKYSEEKIDELYRDMCRYVFTDEILMQTLPIENAKTILEVLSSTYDLFIVTARPKEDEEILRKWLEKNDINCIKQIFYSKDISKQDICVNNNIRFLCDDDIRHLKEDIISYRLLFNQSLEDNNNQEKIDNIKAVNNWIDIFNFININIG